MTTDARNTERQLVLELKNQSRDMEALVRQHFPMVYATCLRITHDRHDAEDAAQAVFLCLAVQLREKREIRALGPWLHQVAWRASVDLCRRRKRRNVHECSAVADLAASSGSDPAGQAGFQEVRPVLLSCLNALPAKYRLPLILHYFGGMSHAEMSRELGCTRPTLRVRMYRGHNMLRDSLKGHGIQLAGGALGLALASAVQWQVSQTLGAAAGMGVQSSGLGIAGLTASPDVITAAFSAAGPRIGHIKLALLISAVAASCLAAGAPLLAKLRDWRELPVPSIRDLAPAIKPIFTAPLPQISEAPRPANTPSVAPHSPPASFAGPIKLPSAPTAAITSLAPLRVPPLTKTMSAKPAAPRGTVAAGPLPWTQPLDGLVQVTLRPNRQAAPARYASASIPSPAPFHEFHGNRRRTGASGNRSGDMSSTPAEIITRVTIPASSSSLWENTEYTTSNAHPIREANPVLISWNRADVLASVQAIRLDGDGSRTVSDTAFGHNAAALMLSGPQYANLAYDAVITTTTTYRRVLTNNGQVIAVGERVAYHDTDEIRNSIDNTSVNGWFAAQRGEISLPPIRLTAGGQWRNWGEEQSDPQIDLINSVRLNLDSGGNEELRISLLSADNYAVPRLPEGHHFVGIWKMIGGSSIVGDIGLTIRYDDTLLAQQGLDERNVKLWYFGAGSWQRSTEGFFRDTELNYVGGEIPPSGFFAVSTPEPSCAGIILFLGTAGLLRRSRRSQGVPEMIARCRAPIAAKRFAGQQKGNHDRHS